MGKLTFLGQSGFFIEGERHNILIDPFITTNPLSQAAGLSADQFEPHGIVLSHGHFDHIEDVVPIAKRTNAVVVGAYELVNYLTQQGAPEGFPMNPGGEHTFPFGSVRLTKAFHGSSGPDGTYLGPACGIVLTTDDALTLYHAGDTEVFGDMEMIGRLYRPKVALLPIGSTFTMDPSQALEAVKLLQPEVVIPMHYNTFPPIQQDPQAFKQQVEAETSAEVVVLQPGASWSNS